MFSTLSKGNVLYGLDRTGKVKWFTASVENVTPTIGSHNSNMFGQMPELRLDIVCDINGEKKTFQQVPSNSAIADFGENSFVIADNKDSLYNYTKDLRKKSKTIAESAPFHEQRVIEYDEVLNDIVPGSAGNDEVKALKEEVGSLKSQLAEAISLLKEKAKQTS